MKIVDVTLKVPLSVDPIAVINSIYIVQYLRVFERLKVNSLIKNTHFYTIFYTLEPIKILTIFKQ